tara:strand:- start:8729 stop:9442 length:714 start_codon:yes stop_codon:yes gene_type:complete
MSADKFDNELSSLYQQRKQKIQPPVFAAAIAAKPSKIQRSPWHILALLLTGGIASFAIMAVVTHFAKPPVHGNSAQYKQHSVRVVELTDIATPENVLPPVTPPLPPKPESLPPKYSENSSVSREGLTLTKAKLSVNKTLSHTVNVPTIKQASIAIVPIHRVMPEYPKSALYARKSGTVKLQYRISDEGKVIDITGLTQHGNRLLERSAKQALTQWRYPAASGGKALLEIEFEFNLVQ